MYQSYFGLNQLPFNLTPDTEFFYNLPSHVEALNVLLVALQSGEGFIKITGNVGTGKTMLCRKLLNELSPPYITAYIPNPNLTPAGLYLTIAEEIGIQSAYKINQNKLLSRINDYLIFAASSNTQPVLIIDEVQAMPIETLEALRLLTNLETEKQKLLQIVLFGQPELNQLLQYKNIRQLTQRITFSYQLKELSYNEVRSYIQHRLQVAGNMDRVRFTDFALLALYYYSRGIPRLVNILAHKGLLAAYGEGQMYIGLRHVHFAALDTESTHSRIMLWGASKRYWLILIMALTTLIWTKLQVAP